MRKYQLAGKIAKISEKYVIKHLPEFQLKSLIRNNVLEKQLSKEGASSVNAVNALMQESNAAVPVVSTGETVMSTVYPKFPLPKVPYTFWKNPRGTGGWGRFEWGTLRSGGTHLVQGGEGHMYGKNWREFELRYEKYLKWCKENGVEPQYDKNGFRLNNEKELLLDEYHKVLQNNNLNINQETPINSPNLKTNIVPEDIPELYYKSGGIINYTKFYK